MKPTFNGRLFFDFDVTNALDDVISFNLIGKFSMIRTYARKSVVGV